MGLLAYIALLAVASRNHDPRLWGTHLIGFLAPAPAMLIWYSLCAALVLAVTGAVILIRPGAARESPPAAASSPRAAIPTTLALLAFVVGSGIIFWVFRAQTQFLGDGMVWLAIIRRGDYFEASEPLAQALLTGLGSYLRSAGLAITASTVAPFSVACGLVASVAIWGTAREISSDSRRFLPTLLLLATMGSSALFFGYVESYPPVAVLVLAFVFAGLRASRTASAPWLPGVVLAIGLASHLAFAYLFPAYLYLVFRDVHGPGKRTAYLLAPGVVGIGLMLVLGFGPDRWQYTLRVATQAFHPNLAQSQAHPHDARPYPILSLAHGVDVGNLLLLVLPAPLLLLVSRVIAVRGLPGRNPRDSFLAWCAVPGFIVACCLVLPVAAAQDWDLFSLLVIPLGIWAIRVGLKELTGPGGALVTAAAVLVGTCGLGSFVLVNADPVAGLTRYSVLTGPGARITPYARAYGHELLAQYYRSHGESRGALDHALALLEIEPTNPRYWAMVGAIHYSRGDYVTAIPYLEESVRRGSKSAGTRTNLGICYAQTGRAADALEQLHIAAAMEPDAPQNHLNLALSLLNAGRADSARIELQETVRRWPQFAPARNAMRRHFGG